MEVGWDEVVFAADVLAAISQLCPRQNQGVGLGREAVSLDCELLPCQRRLDVGGGGDL